MQDTEGATPEAGTAEGQAEAGQRVGGGPGNQQVALAQLQARLLLLRSGLLFPPYHPPLLPLAAPAPVAVVDPEVPHFNFPEEVEVVYEDDQPLVPLAAPVERRVTRSSRAALVAGLGPARQQRGGRL